MIEREKAIEILQRLADGKAEELDIFDNEGGDVCGQILEEQDAILAGIEALKSERPHGEWMPTDEMGYAVSCSQCSFRTCADVAEKEFKFCPNCGADMREGDENGTSS